MSQVKFTSAFYSPSLTLGAHLSVKYISVYFFLPFSPSISSMATASVTGKVTTTVVSATIGPATIEAH